MAKVYAVSVSALNSFQECPFRYKREALDKAYPFEESAATVRGTAVHAILEAYYSTGVWPQEVYDFSAKLAQPMVDLVVKKIGGFVKDSVVTATARQIGLQLKDVPTMTAYLSVVRYWGMYPDEVRDPVAEVNVFKETHRRMRDSLLREGKLQPEARIVLDRWGRQVATPFTDGAMTQIAADVLVVGDNRAVVIDWKTGKLNVDYADGHLKQVAYYAHHVFKAYPDVQEVHAYVIHPLVEGGGSICRVYTPNSPEVLEVAKEAEQLYDTIVKYRKGETPAVLLEKRKTGLCKAYCPVLECENNGRR